MNSVKIILTNQVYVSDLVAQRQHVTALGSVKRKRMPKEEHIVITDTHTPLVSREQFQAAQNLLNRRSFRKTSGRPNLFSYLLFCADCGHGMYYVKRDYGNAHYICGNYQKRGAHHCSRHPIREKYLEQLILHDLKKLIGEHVDTDRLMADMRKEADDERKRSEKEMASLEKKIEKLEQRKIAAENKWLDGDWDKERYHEALERFQNELLEYRQQMLKLQKAQDNTKLALPDIAKLTKPDRLDRQLILLLVKRIEVKENGDSTIIYNFTI